MDAEGIKVSLFKNSSSSFLALLNREKINYERPILAGDVFASGEYIEILGGLAAIAKYLAPVLVEWLKLRASRKVILQTKDNEIVHLEGYSQDEIEKLLLKTDSLTVIDTKSNSE